MGAAKKTAVAAAAGTVVLGGVLVGLGQGLPSNEDDFPAFNQNPGISVNDLKDEEKKDEGAKAAEPAKAGKPDVDGDAVDNLREDPSNLIADYCRNSKLPAGEGKDDKGGTCVSFPIGEVAKNPVRVAIPNAPATVAAKKDFTLDIKIEDKFGPLDLNAFTNDESGGAGTTFLEHPGELDKDGRPLIHAHLGVTTVDKNGFPGDSYDVAFTGLQGVKGDIKATVAGLEPGTYRVDVYVGQPGHAPIPTAKATNVQAFASFEVKVK